MANYNSFSEVSQRAMDNFTRQCLKVTMEAMTKTNPTPKFEITPDMVQRAYDAVPDKMLFKSTVEAMLDAALNPPSEPEIVVTDEMEQAGSLVVERRFHFSTANGDVACDIYRAMRKLEPKA